MTRLSPQIVLSLLLAPVFVTEACSTSADEQLVNPGPRPASIGAAISPVATPAPTIPGYQHNIAASHIHLGPNVSSSQQGSLYLWSGDDGVFTTNSVSGLVFASQSARSPAYLAAPFSGGFEGHKNMVKSYFTEAGLPADQIRTVTGFTKATQSGLAGQPAAAPPAIKGYSSTLSRSFAGYPIVESVADAQFNVNSEVVREVVYWPELPLTLVSDAEEIAAVLADAVKGPLYLGALPVQGATSVAIHHSVDSPNGLVYFASCDVRADGFSLRHFSASGAELRLPEEQRIP